jgi:hypothetical protein
VMILEPCGLKATFEISPSCPMRIATHAPGGQRGRGGTARVWAKGGEARGEVRRHVRDVAATVTRSSPCLRLRECHGRKVRGLRPGAVRVVLCGWAHLSWCCRRAPCRLQTPSRCARPARDKTHADARTHAHTHAHTREVSGEKRRQGRGRYKARASTEPVPGGYTHIYIRHADTRPPNAPRVVRCLNAYALPQVHSSAPSGSYRAGEADVKDLVVVPAHCGHALARVRVPDLCARAQRPGHTDGRHARRREERVGE